MKCEGLNIKCGPSVGSLCHIEVPVRLRSLIKAVRCRSPLRASHDHSASVGVLCIVSHSTKSQRTPLRLTRRPVVYRLTCSMDAPVQCASKASRLA